jgi:hypothetical protein
MKEIFKEQHYKHCNNCGTRFEIDHLITSCTHCGNGIDNCEFKFVQEDDCCGAAINAITNNRYGSWFCKDSRDHLCHYDGEILEDKKGDYITLLNGEKEHLKDYDEEEHYWESCLFCGAPEERK